MSRQAVSSGGLRAYARHRKVTPHAVEKAIASQRLSRSVSRVGRRIVIDFAAADAEWAANSGRVKRGEGSGTTLVEAQRLVAVERARGLKLANDVKRRALIPAEEATRQAFEFARIVRENVLNLPARLSAQLAAETDPRAVFLVLDAELRQALVTTAEQMERAS